ncbi:hypothetical protein [Roseococcus microcysteis]|uniref:hypothetical protein n=1 Tax=Roseococcus microcysteis TaxID=2771361 RepID=UPI001CC707A3|nr:hypothetical protein [Roseococcus microcysteis]
MSRILPLLALLAGCAPLATALDPPLGQLARWEGASDAAIAAEPVACPPGHAACARLHARRAEACMRLAMDSRAPGAACPGSVAHLDCAAQGYAAARALAPHPALAQGEAQARLCHAAFLPRAEAAAEAARARDAASAAPVESRGWLRARAALVLSHPAIGNLSANCAAARAGLAEAPPGSAEARDLAARIATLPSCGDAP